MTTLLRRMFWLALLGGGGFAAWSWRQRRSATESVAAPEWPPLDPPTTSEIATAVPSGGPPPTAGWVAPVDGGCPDGFPVKANDNSGIYHVPGGRFYDRTVPERCYARTVDAEADGYRAAKA